MTCQRTIDVSCALVLCSPPCLLSFLSDFIVFQCFQWFKSHRHFQSTIRRCSHLFSPRADFIVKSLAPLTFYGNTLVMLHFNRSRWFKTHCGKNNTCSYHYHRQQTKLQYKKQNISLKHQTTITLKPSERQQGKVFSPNSQDRMQRFVSRFDHWRDG